MFTDLKDYQEIAKIYAEKVSKPENLEERKGSSPEQLAQNRKDAFKGVPNSPSNKRAEMSKKRRGDKKFEFNKPTGGAQGRTRRPEIKKSLPTTAEIRAKDKAAGGTGMSNIPSKEGNAVIDGKKLNPDFGKKVDIKKEFPDKVDPKPLTKKEKFDKKFIRDPKTKTLKRRGSPTAQRAENKEKAKLRAKEMFKKRQEDKAAGKPQLSGKEKAQAMAKARIAAKKAAMEEYTPYDFVLEYLLSTEQVATIEEANYVMTEMDAETIQGIVEEQKKIFDEGLGSMILKTGAAIGGALLAKKGLGDMKKKFDNYLNKQRDKGIGGNTRPGSDKMYYGDKKEK